MKSSLFIAALPFTVALFTSFSIHATANAKIEQRYINAKIVRTVASSLESNVIPVELKVRLLDSARPEDKEFAKSLIINWKKNSGLHAQAEFDELVVRDNEGYEILRMRALDEARAFQINGRKWTIPAKGSISKSLQKHLESNSDEAAISGSPKKNFALKILGASVPNAFAAKPEAQLIPVAPAYLFMSAKEQQAVTAAEALTANSPARYISVGIGADLIHDLFGSSIGSELEVTCQGTKAVGSGKINGDRFQFESQADGTMLFTIPSTSPNKKTEPVRLLVTSRKMSQDEVIAARKADLLKFATTKDGALAEKIFKDFMARPKLRDKLESAFNRQLRKNLAKDLPEKDQAKMYASFVNRHSQPILEYYSSLDGRPVVTDEMTAAVCSDRACSSVEVAGQQSTIQRWLTNHDKLPIDNALKWRSVGLKSSKAKIVQIETSTIPQFAIQPATAKLSKADEEIAKRLIAEATEAANSSYGEVHGMMKALRPLGACCAETDCPPLLLEQNVKLIQDKPAPVRK